MHGHVNAHALIYVYIIMLYYTHTVYKYYVFVSLQGAFVITTKPAP